MHFTTHKSGRFDKKIQHSGFVLNGMKVGSRKYFKNNICTIKNNGLVLHHH